MQLKSNAPSYYPWSAIYNCHDLRTESVMVRPRSHATGENPFSRLQVADIGDVVASLYNVQVGVTAHCAGGDIVPACCRRPAPPSRSSTPPSSPGAACRSPWAGTTSSPTPSSGQQPPRTGPSRSEEYIHLCRASNEGFTITEKAPLLGSSPS